MHFSKDQKCQGAIISEVNGLLATNDRGQSPLKIAHRNDKICQGKQVIKSTMAVRWKSPEKAKAMLCSMGVIIPLNGPVSATAPFLSSLKSIVILACSFQFRLGSIEVSQAVLQPDAISEKDQILMEPPGPWVSCSSMAAENFDRSTQKQRA